MKSSSELIFVKASIRFKSTEEGGKDRPVRTGYRPNHVFEQPSNIRNLVTYVGELQFSEQECIHPGETKSVTVMFGRFGEIDKFLKVGQKWFIYEGHRLVGEGEILEIL